MLKPQHVVTRMARLYGNLIAKLLNYAFLKCSYYILFIIILTGVGSNTFAQEKAKKVAGTFVYGGKAYNYEFNKLASNNYSFAVNSLTNNSTSTTDTNSSATTDSESTTDPASSTDTTTNAENTIPHPDTTATTGSTADNTTEKSVGNEIFDEFSKDVFCELFKHQMKSKYGLTDDNDPKTLLNKKGLELFFIIQSKLDFLDDEPVTAHMVLKKDRVNSILISNSSSFYNASLSYPVVKHNIKSVDIETEDGAIKNIIVLVEAKNSRGSIEFKNTYPISISGKHDAERLSKIRLSVLTAMA